MTGAPIPEPDFDALYRDVILEHYREPRGKESIPREDARAEGLNPLCGDEVDVAIAIEDGTCQGLQVDGRGCAISVASGSMLYDLVAGRPLDEVRRVIAAVREVMNGAGMPDDTDLGDFDALEGVRQFPVRIKCALLPWTTLEDALREVESRVNGHESDKGAPS